MTQMQTDTVTLYKVFGKDRLSDDWTPFESRYLWEVERWAEQRAFVRREHLSDALLVETRQPGLAQIERKDAEQGWVPHTAWEPYIRAAKWLEQFSERQPGTVGFYRLVEQENSPA